MGTRKPRKLFKQAAEAYAVLADAQKRSLYDRFGHAGVIGAGGAAAFDPTTDYSDIVGGLGDAFGFGDAFGRRAPAGEDARRAAVERAKREGRDAAASHPQQQTERVNCTVFAPSAIRTGDSLLLQVFAHLEADAAIAERLAKSYDPKASTKGATLLNVPLARGTELAFTLQIPGAVVDDPVQTLVWRGVPRSVNSV